MADRGATRRQVLAASGAMPLAAAAPAIAPPAVGWRVADDLRRYIGFGTKAAGGSGDLACGAWLDGELRSAGFATTRQSYDVPWFDADRADVSVGGDPIPVWPQPIVTPTPAGGLSGPLVRVDRFGRADRPLAGTIALIDLPFGRWSSLASREIKGPLDAAFAGGAIAALLVTNGPTGKAIALNCDGRRPMAPGPVAVVAPDRAAPLFAAASAGSLARLRLTGRGGRRPTFNLAGRIDRGRGRWLVVSTPRSGWFTCAGERGGGIAAWLHLARLAPAAFPAHDLLFVCNSGHEYLYLGAEELIRDVAPPPAATRFWLHLGANLAARDWHDSVAGLNPISGTDSQRYLVVSKPLLVIARNLFKSLAGLESPYTPDQITAGELAHIVAAGYSSVAGIFGLHRFHHVAEDDARCVDPAAVAATTIAFEHLLKEAA